MSARREASTPPQIAGHTPVRLLGMGGFADVFLYEQQRPRRAVAVKVLLAAHLSDEVRERFRTEADLMAQLSHHPSIVTIHHAEVARDGRPYLVMEYCSRPGLGQRYRTERMSVAEVLRIGIRLASAVETAHRAGILHRDIKPANVLITDFGWPALTDFGIAATTLAAGAATGMSIPWSPPEVLADDPSGDARADVYSLGATVYSLLARRSPFEVAGASNTAADLVQRIERSPLAPVGRPDVPASLDDVLARAMAKDPGARPSSALALARALQQVEAELMLPLTPLDLPEADDGAVHDDGQDADATRLRPVQTISPDAPSAPPATGASAASAASVPGADDQVATDDVTRGLRARATSTATRPPTAPAVEPDPLVRLPVGPDGVPLDWHSETAAPEPVTASRGRRVATAAAAVVLVTAAATAAALAFTSPPRAPVEEPTAVASQSPGPLVAVPSPTDVTGTVEPDGTVVFTWTNPDPADGDSYAWGVVVAGDEPVLEMTQEPTAVVVPEVAGEQVCIEVSVVRSDRRVSTRPAVGCAG